VPFLPLPEAICRPHPKGLPHPRPQLHAVNDSPGCTAPPGHPRQPAAPRHRPRAHETASWGLHLACSNRRPGSRVSWRARRQPPRLPPAPVRAWRHRVPPGAAPVATAPSEGMGNRAAHYSYPMSECQERGGGRRCGKPFHPPTFASNSGDGRSDTRRATHTSGSLSRRAARAILLEPAGPNPIKMYRVPLYRVPSGLTSAPSQTIIFSPLMRMVMVGGSYTYTHTHPLGRVRSPASGTEDR